MLKVCGHRLMIKPDPVEKKTASGIVLAVDEKLHRAATDVGTVVQVGETAWFGFADNRQWCAVGDKVQYARYASKFVIDPETDEEFVILNDDDVQVIIVKGKE